MQHWTRTRTRSNPFEPVPVQNAFKRRSKGVHYPFATRSLGVKMLPFGGPKNTKIMSQNKGWKIHFLGWRLKSCWFMLVHVDTCVGFGDLKWLPNGKPWKFMNNLSISHCTGPKKWATMMFLFQRFEQFEQREAVLCWKSRICYRHWSLRISLKQVSVVLCTKKV